VVNLWFQQCGSSDNINTTFVDGGTTTLCSAINAGGGEVDPTETGFGPPLATLNGLDAQGEWRLQLNDVFPLDSGTLDQWALHFTTEDLCEAECPDPLPGRPLNGERVLRGYLIGWAVDEQTGEEIRWNHLSGGATLVNTEASSAWEYTAYTAAIDNGAAHGAPSGTPGVLNLGVPGTPEYAAGFDFLLLDFFAVGNGGFGTLPVGITNTSLTLLPLDIDVRQIGVQTITKAEILIWNENEFKISGTRHCVFCWDQVELEDIDPVNGFLITNLQTDKGRARIDGVAHNSEFVPPRCWIDFDDRDELPVGDDPRDILSVDKSMLGVSHSVIAFHGQRQLGEVEETGTHLVGAGTQSAVIQWDYDAVGGGGGSPEAPDVMDDPIVVKTLRKLGFDVEKTRRNHGKAAHRAGPPTIDRISASAKGSLVIWPKVELKFDANGAVIQDTYISLNNDFEGDVHVQFYFVQGDDAVEGDEDGPCEEPGCNNFDFAFTLTANQPVYFRVSDGLPLGVPSFIGLDPGAGGMVPDR
jgi:hypothetical protein